MQARHRRTGKTDRTRNVTTYRVEAVWPVNPTRPVVIRGSDRKHIYSSARRWYDTGAHVTIQRHEGHGAWKTVDVLDGPAARNAKREAS
ncbi:hypothetical protein E4K10_18080 [Streptomyces sp. T1317-0309]|nr:hypothetical protein E4K10_18080 [Streptomyces sp. T1317-0309]